MRAPDVPPTPDASRSALDLRMASLDGLRGIAALTIFVFHGWLYTREVPLTADRDSVGDFAAHELRLSVVAFFVLSGFLLYRRWVAAVRGGRAGPDVRRYVRARVARIAPAYYAALLGSIALVWRLDATPGVRLPPASELPLFAVFAQNFSADSVLKLDPPMWSLAVEVTFYALLPLAGWLALRLPRTLRAQAAVPLALIAAGVAFNLAIAGRGLGMTFSKTLPAMAPYFGLGMLAALVLHDRPLTTRSRRALLAGGLALILADATVKALAGAGVLDVGRLFHVVRDLPSGIGFALVVAALASAVRRGVMGGRVLAGLGTVSYGFYLWHVPVLWWLRGHGLLPLDFVLGSLVALGPALALATASWFALERPAIRWAHARNRRAGDARRPSGEAQTARRPSGDGDADRLGRVPREVGAVRT